MTVICYRERFLGLSGSINEASCEIDVCGIDLGLYDHVFRGLLTRHAATVTEEWINPCYLYVLQDFASTALKIQEKEAKDLDENQYQVASLREDDAPLIDSTWKYRSETSIKMITRMIESGRCCGVRRKPDDTLVSWSLIYEDGALGMLFTLPEHRGKKLASIVVKSLLMKLLDDTNYTAAPFCFIETGNEVSQYLFRSMGFEKKSDVAWVGLKCR